MPPPVLEVQGLKIWFDDQPVVDGVDLTVGPGEIVALVGESGAGKTLTALALGRLLPPGARWTAKAIRCRGRDLHALSDDALRAVLGADLAYVFQDPAACLNPVMTVAEQLAEPLRIHSAKKYGGRTADVTPQLKAALAAVQLEDPAAILVRYPHQLSGGMQQRVMLAMAALLNPALLIADEPTTALDATTQAQILALLARWRRERGMSCLLITHDLVYVAPIADRIAVMAGGRIVETAPTAQLYRSPRHPYTQALLHAMPTVGGGRWTL